MRKNNHTEHSTGTGLLLYCPLRQPMVIKVKAAISLDQPAHQLFADGPIKLTLRRHHREGGALELQLPAAFRI